jgi:hypothetical protein
MIDGLKDEEEEEEGEGEEDLLMGQSLPGYLHFEQVPSKFTRQIPQVSSESSGRSHFQVARAW